jgi:uncharacterized membrane protein
MFSGDFMRPEVWHALSVHFPIALLPVATIALLISCFAQEINRRHWRIAATLLLFAGCLMAWVATYTGNIADGVVARKLCDPTVLKDHEIAAENMTWLFTIAAVLHFGFLTDFLRPRLRAFSFYLALLLMLVGTGYLVRAGHIGATLVYEQGAGVRNHEADCSDYDR